MEGLFHVAKKLSAGGLRDRGGRNAVDPDLPGIRLIESQKQLEQGTFSGSGAAEKRQLVARSPRQIQVAQDGLVPVVGEGDVSEIRRRARPGKPVCQCGNLSFQASQKLQRRKHLPRPALSPAVRKTPESGECPLPPTG